MTYNEYLSLQTLTQTKLPNTPITLQNTSDRTLLFGQMSDRQQFHVYMKNNQIHGIQYQVTWNNNHAYPNNIKDILNQTNHKMPLKIYAERSDYEICKKLIEHGIKFPLTPWISDNFTIAKQHNPFDKSQYYGYTI